MFSRIMVSKILTKTHSMSSISKDHSPSSIFIDGDSGSKTNLSVVFKQGLAKGEYLITFRAEYDEDHPEKKLVVGAYNEEVDVRM